MPSYRIRLDRSFTSTKQIEVRKFKFRVQIWTSASSRPTTIHAALDTFADYSILPTQSFIKQGGVVPPTLLPPGVAHADDTIDICFCDAPDPIRHLKFPSDPCRFEHRLPPSQRFQLALRDLIPHFTLQLDEDPHGELWLILSLRVGHRGSKA